MESSKPRSDRSVLWTMIGSDGFLVSTLKRCRLAFFFPPYTASFWNPLSKSLLASLWNPFSITLNPHSSLPLLSLPLSKIAFNPYTLKSQSLFRCCLSPSRCRTVAAQPFSLSCLFVTLSSLPLSLVAIATQPRSQLPRRRRSSAQVLYLWYYQYQRFKLAIKTFSLFFFFFGYELSEIFVCGYVICLSRLLFCVWIKPMTHSMDSFLSPYQYNNGFCLV